MSAHETHATVALADMTARSPRGEGNPVLAGRATARLVARPGISIAASAPVAMVVLAALPEERPLDVFANALALLAAVVLIVAAEVASFERQPVQRQVPSPPARHTSWADPGMISVERWLGNWPGLAGVSAASWWAARAGAAGLLARLAFASLGLPYAAAWAAGAVGCLGVAICTSAGRHMAHVALAAVAATGLLTTFSAGIAALEGHLRTNLGPAGPLWPSARSAGTVIVESSTTVALLCLAGASFLAVTPATANRGTRLGKRVTWAAVAAAVGTWGFVLPMLARRAGLGLPLELARGRTGALRSALATLLHPVAAGAAPGTARALLFIACLAGAAGALSGAHSLAESAVDAGRAARRRAASSRAAAPGEGRVPSGLPPRVSLPWGVVTGTALATAGAGAAVSWAGPRTWLLVSIGSLAAGALALTVLAPPALAQCQKVPIAVRGAVAGTWALVATVGVGAAGPLALVLAGATALTGALVVGWRALPPVPGTGRRWPALPWGTVAAAVMTASAVAAIELLPAASDGTVPGLCQGLAVVVVGAGVVVLAVFPATSRQRVGRLAESASVLANKTLPALAAALEELGQGGSPRSVGDELSELKVATRPLEAELATRPSPDELSALTAALAQATTQALRLALAVEEVAGIDSRRLEELVEERLTAVSSANRNLVDSQWRRRQLLERTVRVAEGERARIAANIHDGPIQRLAAIGLVLDRSRLRLDRDDTAGTRELMARARAELGEEIQGLRRMMSELRPPILDEGGLEAALRDHMSAWSAATGIEARLEPGPRGALNANSEMVVYRVVQESLANVAKHARAKLTTVTLAQSGDGVQVVIRDNGRGFNAQSQPDLLRGGHFGLVVMRERVELAAGLFEVRSAPRTGTEVLVWLPTISEPVEAA